MIAAAPARAAVLLLDDYLVQVRKSDPAYRSEIETSTASEQTSRAANLLFRPQFFAKAQYVDDTRTTSAPSIFGSSNIQRNYSIGVRQQTPYGLGIQLSFDYNQTSLLNTDPNLVTHAALTNQYVVPLFQFSLWQNLLGRSDRANQSVMKAQDLAEAYGEAYHAQATLVEAEVNYWRLAAAREVTRLQNESVDRARAFLEHDEKAQKRHLGDSSSLLLAQAAVKGKELELQGRVDEEESLARAFNQSRGIDSDQVSENLELPDTKVLQNLSAIRRAEMRGDVKAAQQAAIAKASGSDMAREKMLPELKLYGSIFAWGVDFSFPLDLWTTSAVRAGYAQKAAAADLEFQKKAQTDMSEWKDLVRKFNEAKQRLSVAVDLESIQKNKFQYIQKRLALGLTIEDQVFQYELDYLNAELARVQIEGMILALHAQMKLYADRGTQQAGVAQ